MNQFVSQKFVGHCNQAGLFAGKGVLFDMGLVTTSSVAGAVMVAYLAFAWLNHQPRVIASLKTQEEGVRKLTLSYTGTTKEAEAARKKGKELEEESPATQTSQIRDWTGSGREHVPEQVEFLFRIHIVTVLLLLPLIKYKFGGGGHRQIAKIDVSPMTVLRHLQGRSKIPPSQCQWDVLG